jgi:hypothetical protein
MGLFDKLFSKEKDFPEIDDSSPIAQRVDRFKQDLEGLAKDIEDPLEVIPTQDAAYVFIGKPPKKFGMAWIKDGRVHNFRTLAQEQGVSEMKLQLMSEKLRKAYESSDTASRFSASIADQKIIVTESYTLEQNLKDIIP